MPVQALPTCCGPLDTGSEKFEKGCVGFEKDLSRMGTLTRGDASVESPFAPQHVPFKSSTATVLVVHPKGAFPNSVMDGKGYPFDVLVLA